MEITKKWRSHQKWKTVVGATSFFCAYSCTEKTFLFLPPTVNQPLIREIWALFFTFEPPILDFRPPQGPFRKVFWLNEMNFFVFFSLLWAIFFSKIVKSHFSGKTSANVRDHPHRLKTPKFHVFLSIFQVFFKYF